MNCVIVIPYYQKEDGVLRRALKSVFDQTFQNFGVVIVDDASPYPIESELAPLNVDQKSRITIIKQANGGPGAARNAGLDAAVESQADFVALLDSDDVWDKGHLERAASAMSDHNADIFLATITGGAEFDYHSSFDALLRTDDAVRLANKKPFYRIDDLINHMIEDWSFMHLSCLALSRKLYGTVRFQKELRLAGEDVLFFHDCLTASSNTILCTEPGAVRGMGANLFHGVSSIEDIFIHQQACVLRMFDLMSRRTGASEALRSVLARRKQDTRLEVMWGQRDRLKAGRSLQVSTLTSLVLQDPALPASVLNYFLRRNAYKRARSGQAKA
ncbi:MAG: succinoglycan biosynthesis protein exow [Hirschia sp.]|nr:succinoglycan biosynthesis protein exow [Hirschia sp.]MBF19713.1 succinoglycan biosynthesis protein exow [Hirschia sp.]|tara:strand:- start:854 stop:1843 length:990 start_codon:yes stop_codon:yes gene_type:complete